MSPRAVPIWARRLGGLAIVLAILAFATVGRAEAAGPHDHHAAIADHAPAAQPQPAPAHDHDKGGVHHGGGCHCLSAACISVLPLTVSELRVVLPRARHALPTPQSALALAGVDPPAEPPRT